MNYLIKKILVQNQKKEIDNFFHLKPNLPLPLGISEIDLFSFLKSVLVCDATAHEMGNYCIQDFKRFVYN